MLFTDNRRYLSPNAFLASTQNDFKNVMRTSFPAFGVLNIYLPKSHLPVLSFI